MNEKTRIFVENISESGMACLVTMVQGNVLALSLSHLMIATQTGLIAGATASVAVLITKPGKRWVVAAILGVVTTVVDFFVHPGMFGSLATEAVVTGAGAAALSYAVGTLLHRFNTRSADSAK